MIGCSDKLTQLPPYLFSRINQLKREAFTKKLDVIDLGMGVLHHPTTHRYPQAKGMPKFRRTAADWLERRFGVTLDPEREVLALIGTKEGIAHLAMALLNPGELALVGDPAYPVHRNGVILAGGEVFFLPLRQENQYLPDLGAIPTAIAQRAKLLLLNYPNNPTTAVVEDLTFFKEVVAFAKKYDLVVCHDNPYCEITFDGYVAPSFLQVPGAKAIGVECFSFSKTYNMAGWRVGWMCGSERIVGYVEKFKSFIDYGVPTFLQLAGVSALQSPLAVVAETVKIYQRRRDQWVQGLAKLGWQVPTPKATMYVWAPLPERFRAQGSLAFAERLIQETGIVVAPGVGFGPGGEGYVRMALVTHDHRFHDALLRLKKFLRQEPVSMPGSRGPGGEPGAVAE
ncbi:MAG: aminotransferase class I/II-fold pyridoxal phosphate-dependent enzyme [Elusimicrobia bacterium]|nr:aminotransferase class I/II-fold pyridoxal phosphate-dependent enzyme [Elusimicrobiota bacterium]